MTRRFLYRPWVPALLAASFMIGCDDHARVARVVFGARDPKWGGAGSLYSFADDQRFNHQPDIIGGILPDECRNLIRDFFRQRRQKA